MNVLNAFAFCLTTYLNNKTNAIRSFAKKHELNLPVGVKGFTLATGRSFVLEQLPVTIRGTLKRLLLATGVIQTLEDFSKIVFGVNGLSNNRNALTRLYGGL